MKPANLVYELIKQTFFLAENMFGTIDLDLPLNVCN